VHSQNITPRPPFLKIQLSRLAFGTSEQNYIALHTSTYYVLPLCRCLLTLRFPCIYYFTTENRSKLWTTEIEYYRSMQTLTFNPFK
jgi:hypothetical protein